MLGLFVTAPPSSREKPNLRPICRVVDDTQNTTDGPRGPGGASRVSGGR